MAGTPDTAESRRCEACGKLYSRKNGVGRLQFNRSRACCRSCACALGQANRRWPTIEQRFWDKVDKTPGFGPWGDCWRWTGGCDEFGYGSLNRGGQKGRTAHRTSYELNVGAIPTGLVVRHKCDTPSCVRPDHLETGTHQDNSDDQVARGRQRAPKGEESPRAKLSEKQVVAIHGDPRSQRAIADDYGISQSAVMMIKTERNWKHLWRRS